MNTINKKKQIDPIIIDGVESVTTEYQKTPAKTFGGKLLRIFSKFLPFILKSIK